MIVLVALLHGDLVYCSCCLECHIVRCALQTRQMENLNRQQHVAKFNISTPVYKSKYTAYSISGVLCEKMTVLLCRYFLSVCMR